MKEQGPDYKQIYMDMIQMKYPDKFENCRTILQKKRLAVLDVLELNQIIFGLKDMETERFNQRHRSYDKLTITRILELQQKNGYSNTEISNQFKISRNTVAKWKKTFLF
ncbi:transposase [Chryseobacterium piperi]|uniref:Transposase n=1 Tax=Chryseobacterium piperi TaxID=558152 RepID=A0A086BMS6_9FLAO|nr:transposase [Chryseobacterium piperi]ASW75029.1 transposase [Chryseobacterium piperi]KFF30240.1 transposase [Chryseobacterium piperi]